VAKKKTSKRSAPATEHHLDGVRVRQAREAKKWRLKDLAAKDATDLPISTLSRIENGKTEVRSDTLVALARALEVSTDWLLGLSNTRTRQP
jgi:transcriptional regulator with XRE-family HTH domain